MLHNISEGMIIGVGKRQKKKTDADGR